MLEQEWKPILTLRQIVFTIELLLQEPPEKELFEPQSRNWSPIKLDRNLED